MKISACLIVRDEPLLAQAVASVRPYVDEVVIVDTGSEDVSVAKSLADRFEVFTDCNDADGKIADFSQARQRSFDLATHNTVLWLDADDEVCGLENLKFTERGAHTRFLAPYEYAYNEAGDCIRVHQRERIVTDKNAFRWDRRVHEGLVAKKDMRTVDAYLQGVVWKHRKDHTTSKDLDRNLRILRSVHKEEYAAGHIEPRTLYDLGVEEYLRGLHLDAIHHLNRYVSASGWDAERFQACLRLVDLHSIYGRWKDATECAQRAIDICPNDPQGYFAIAKVEHQQATGDNETRALKRSWFYGTKGLDMPDLQGSLLSNPQDRLLAIPEMLADVATRLEHPVNAEAMYRKCLEVRPNDPLLRLRCHEPSTGLDIIIACARVGEPWNPETVAKSGIGGSETAVIEMAKRLVAKGARVRVFCDTPTDGLFDGVEYRCHAAMSSIKHCDLLVAWRDAGLLSFISAKSKWLWIHDTGIHGSSPWNLHLADRILALSQWHADHLAKKCGADPKKISVTSNGIDLTRFEGRPERHPHRALYTSSPDRGLEELLKIWPAIRDAVPDAELRIFYGWGAAELQPADSEMGLFVIRVKKMLADLAPLGVSHHGRVDQKTLASEMLQAGAWLYPSWAMQSGGYPFTETNCISVQEAQAAGMAVVVGRSGALPEMTKSGIFVEPGDNEYFTDASVAALLFPEDLHREITKEAAKAFSWDNVVNQWLGWAAKDVDSKPRFTDSTLPTLHMVLAPHISGETPIDIHDAQATTALGGCRDGFLGLAKAMGLRGGFRVRAFATFKDRHTVKGGVEYVRVDEFNGYDKPDALLAYYDTAPLQNQTGMLRIGSHHAYVPYSHFEWTDVNLAPSHVSMEFLRDRYDPTGKWHVLPNGVELSIARKPVSGRVIYHTSPDRGLHLLLDAWPEIRRRLPHATLHVTGKVAEFASGQYIELRQNQRAEAVARSLVKAETAGGLTLLGRLSREDLDNELSEASVFAFPCSPIGPCETFSVAVMESLLIGLPVVLRPADALWSIYEGSVRMVGDQDLADGICETLASPDEDIVARGHSLASHHTFANQAEVLAQILRTHLPIKAPAKAKIVNGVYHSINS